MAAYHTGAAPTNGPVNGGDSKIRAAHLLVKHKDSRRPSSWKEPNITRNQAEALQIIRSHQARIKAGEATLGDLAMKESDCSSARKQGDLYETALVQRFMVIF